METRTVAKRTHPVKLALPVFLLALALRGQDPSEPPAGKPRPAPTNPPTGALSRSAVDGTALRTTIDELVACGTRHSLSSWEDSRRGIGCGRDRIVARYEEIAKRSGGRLQVLVDRFEASSPRTHDKPARFENVLAFLPGTDPVLAKTVFWATSPASTRKSSASWPSRRPLLPEFKCRAA